MESNLLHEAIISVLLESGKPLSVKEIQEKIETQELWKRPSDGQIPKVEQVSARVNNYSHLFLRQNGVVSLLKKSQENRFESRLLRLTWNTNRWELPSGHRWKKGNQGKSNIAHENQYGFGGEEWLLNPRYQVGEYQYGYIRGAMGLSKINLVDKAVLFTFNQSTKEKFIVGEITNLEIIHNNSKAQKVANDLIDKYYNVMESELKEVNADYTAFNKEGFLSNIRFKTSNFQLYNELIPIPNLDTVRYKRFNPYKIEGDLELILDGYLPKNKFIFRPGIAKNVTQYSRTTTKTITDIERTHSQITDCLIDYLLLSHEKQNISVEKTAFGNNLADIVIKHNLNKISIIEVKSSDNARKNIRDAIGQLLDYAFWYDNIEIEELIVVAPNKLTENEIALFERMQSVINLKLTYWRWLKEEVAIKNKIIKVL